MADRRGEAEEGSAMSDRRGEEDARRDRLAAEQLDSGASGLNPVRLGFLFLLSPVTSQGGLRSAGRFVTMGLCTFRKENNNNNNNRVCVFFYFAYVSVVFFLSNGIPPLKNEPYGN